MPITKTAENAASRPEAVIPGSPPPTAPAEFSEAELQALKETVFAAYEAEGFSRNLIGEWAISENDVADFVSLARSAAPKRILEVGTYVGVSTMMLAEVCPNAVIHTVDPDFPLSMEMLAIGSSEDVSKQRATHHAIARAAAERLGFSGRIRFYKGGFSVGDTFASSLGDPSARVEVVGPSLCKAHGPFDFVFIDGLHTAEAVMKDLELSAAHISAGAPIVLHDCIGFWGAGVRSGIFEFVRRHRDFMIVYPRFEDVYRSVGVVRERAASLTMARQGKPPPPELRLAVNSIAKNVFGEEEILEIAAGSTFLESDSTRHLHFSTNGQASGVASAIAREKAKRFVSIEIADFADDSTLASILTAVARSDGAILLAATPPGERGVAGPESRPLAGLVDLVRACGLNLFLVPFSEIEHARYGLLPEARPLGQSSLFLFFLVASTGDVFFDAAGREYAKLSGAAARDHEQAELQRVHLAAGFRKQFALAINEQKIRFTEVDQLSSRIDDEAAEADRLREHAAAMELAHATALAESNGRIAALTSDLSSKSEELAVSLRELEAMTAKKQELADAALAAEIASKAEIARAKAEKLEIEAELSGKLEAAQRRSRELMSNLVAAYDTVGSIEAELSAQARIVDGTLVMPMTSDSQETVDSLAAPAGLVRQHSEYITQSLRRILANAEARGPTILGPPPATLNELAAEHERLHLEIERIRRSVSWRLLAIVRVPLRIIRRLLRRR